MTEKTNEHKRYQQTFEPATLLQGGKEIDLYKYIQEMGEDTDLYKTQAKYHGIENAPEDLTTLNEMYGDQAEIKDLKSAYDQVARTEELWYNLPLEVRKEFNHDPKEFAENGLEWLDKKIKAKAEELKAQQQANQPKQNDKE